MDFVSELVRKRGKENLQKFTLFIVEMFMRSDEASLGYKPYRQKGGALLAIGALCDKLKLTEPYDSELERMLVQHVFPEISNPVGHLRAKAAAFWKCMNTAEAEEEGVYAGALAAVGCLRAISTILESVSSLPHLFVHIEQTLLPIMRRMLTTDGQEVFEEVLEIVSYLTFFSPAISLDMWNLWPLMVEALSDWAIDFFPKTLGASAMLCMTNSSPSLPH